MNTEAVIKSETHVIIFFRNRGGAAADVDAGGQDQPGTAAVELQLPEPELKGVQGPG